MKKVVNTFSVSFFVRKERVVKGETKIYVSIVLNKQRMKIATNLFVPISNWDSAKGYPRGSAIEIKQLMMKLDEIKNKYFESYHSLLIKNKSFSVEDVKNDFLGIKDSQQTLLKIFQYHTDTTKNTLSESSKRHFGVTEKYFKEYLAKVYHVTDIPLSRLNLKFITDFEQFVYQKNANTTRPCLHNSMMKHIIRFRKVVNIAIMNDWLDKDPFMKFKSSYTPTNRGFLTLDELKAIEQLELENSRLRLVKDMFVFSCYTGLAYVDVMNLKTDNICIGIDKKSWIKTSRTKTKIPVNLPILPIAADLIEKYKSSPLVERGSVFPFIENRHVNESLKVLAEMCGIPKVVTFHMARHTFATTVTLTNGVPIETVSKMLGHTSIKTTQIYAKVVDSKIGNDMDVLVQKLEKQSELKLAK